MAVWPKSEINLGWLFPFCEQALRASELMGRLCVGTCVFCSGDIHYAGKAGSSKARQGSKRRGPALFVVSIIALW